MPLSLLRGYVSMELCVMVPIILQVRLSLPVRNQCCLPCCGRCCHLAPEVRVSVCCLFCRLWLKVSVCCLFCQSVCGWRSLSVGLSVVEGLCYVFCWSVCGWRSLSVVCSVGLSVDEGFYLLVCLWLKVSVCSVGLSVIECLCLLSGIVCNLPSLLSGTVGQFVILIHAVFCVCLWFAVPVCLGSWDCLCFWFFLFCVFVSDWLCVCCCYKWTVCVCVCNSSVGLIDNHHSGSFSSFQLSQLWWLLYTPAHHFPSLWHVQGSTSTRVFRGGCRSLSHARLGCPFHFSPLWLCSKFIHWLWRGWHVRYDSSLLQVLQQESVYDWYHFHRQAEAKLKRSVGSCSILALYWRDRTSSTQPASSRPWWLQPAGCPTSTCSNRATANWTSWRHTTHSEPTSLRPGKRLCRDSFCESDTGGEYY